MSHILRIFVLVAAIALLLPSAATAQVVINELMYHPLSDKSGDDFVELYNTGGAPVDLSDWCFDGITFCFTPGASIAAGQYLVLSPDADPFPGHLRRSRRTTSTRSNLATTASGSRCSTPPWSCRTR